MPTKAELQRNRDRCQELVNKANVALKQKNYQQAIMHAVESLHFMSAAYRYEKKYNNNDAYSFPTLTILFSLAPCLFNVHVLKAVESVLNDSQSLYKKCHRNLWDELEQTQLKMAHSARYWDQLIEMKSVPAEYSDANGFLNFWIQYGFITIVDQKIMLVTDMNAIVIAKCPQCGRVIRDEKYKLLNENMCSACRTLVRPVILSSAVDAK